MILEGFKLQTSFKWTPYDPNHFISLRRIKYKLGNYAHVRLPHVEKYANSLSWKEGTLEEPITREQMLEREARNIQKEADLETCGHVSFSYQRQLRAAASSSTTHQQVAMKTQQASNKDKGKHVQEEQLPPMTQEQTDKEMEQHQEQQQQQEEIRQEQPVQPEQTVEAPKSTEQQPQQTVPPRQETSVDASILQTTQKEDVSRKRDRETPLTSSINQGEKRQRLNDFSEEYMIIRQSLGMGPPSREASASSFQEE